MNRQQWRAPGERLWAQQSRVLLVEAGNKPRPQPGRLCQPALPAGRYDHRWVYRIILPPIFSAYLEVAGVGRPATEERDDRFPGTLDMCLVVVPGHQQRLTSSLDRAGIYGRSDLDGCRALNLGLPSEQGQGHQQGEHEVPPSIVRSSLRLLLGSGAR